MKSHHVLLTLGALALAGAIGYEYLRRKKKGCNCSGKSGCTCKGKVASSSPTSTTNATVGAAIPVVPAAANNGATSIPSTGLPGMDAFISPSDSWSSWDGMGDDDAGMIDPVRHFVPAMGVQQFNPNQNVVYGNPQMVLLK